MKFNQSTYYVEENNIAQLMLILANQNQFATDKEVTLHYYPNSTNGEYFLTLHT